MRRERAALVSTLAPSANGHGADHDLRQASALQALGLDEAVWFDAFFLANVVPVFYVETLADLEKETAAGKDPEAIVGRLAEKTPPGAAPNVYHGN